MLVGDAPEAKGKKPRSAGLAPAQLADLAVLKLVLFGESVIDLPRCWFTDRTAVDDFLRLLEFDTDNPIDMARLHELHHEATVYLTDTHRYRLPLHIEQPTEIHDLFLAAASSTSPRVQRFACMTLKVMHILHHITGRELLFNTPISEAQLFDRLNTKMFSAIDRMRASGIGVQEFAAGKKSKASLATKLLAKRNNLATHIFDKLRFRIIVNSRDDLILALVWLMHYVVPYNYVLPEQSQNAILTIDDIIRVLDVSPDLANRYWETTTTVPATPVVRPPPNEFSALTYRCINFVADIPMRIDDVATQSAPAIAFVQTEIQLIDMETSKANEKGESSHALYKKRQRSRVRSRLESQGFGEPIDGMIPEGEDEGRGE